MGDVIEEQGTEEEEAPVENPAAPEPADDDDEPEDVEIPFEEPPPAMPAGMSERELEQTRKKLEQSATTWRNRVSQLLGEEANFIVPCELCDPIIPGFHFPVEVEQPRDPTHERLLEVLRTPGEPEYMLAQHVRRCATCDGWGVVLSGSRKPDKARVKCPTCQGNGFQGPGETFAPSAPQNGAPEVEFPEDTRPLVEADADIWGSPKVLPDGSMNENYGKMPQYKNPSLP